MKISTVNEKRIRVICTVLFAILSAAWMGVIFGFSADTAEVSASQSGSVTKFVLSIFVKNFGNLPYEESALLIDKYDPIIRKLAHFAAYAVLGVLTYLAFGSAKQIPRYALKPCALSIPVCVLFSVSDEIHQIFVDGRAGRLYDVVIDSAGAVTGTALVICMLRLVFKREKQQKS